MKFVHTVYRKSLLLMGTGHFKHAVSIALMHTTVPTSTRDVLLMQSSAGCRVQMQDADVNWGFVSSDRTSFQVLSPVPSVKSRWSSHPWSGAIIVEKSLLKCLTSFLSSGINYHLSSRGGYCNRSANYLSIRTIATISHACPGFFVRFCHSR